MANSMTLREAINHALTCKQVQGGGSCPVCVQSTAILEASVEAHEARCAYYDFPYTAHCTEDYAERSWIALSRLRALERGEEGGGDG